MTNKRYTDEEIVKALECCLCDNSECLQCQNKEVCKIECDELATKILDLITRKILEIERLQKEVNLVSIQFQDLQDRTDEIKAKAYKEFADMVKKNIKEVWNYDNGTCSCVLVLTKDIDKILKEMVGEEK